jgi:hypothetical protein
LVVLVHRYKTQEINQVAMADWRKISADADQYAAIP